MKTHLLDSSVPLTEGQDQIAICGAEVKQAAFVTQLDEANAQSVIQSCSCYRCKKPCQAVTGKYVYLITNGENLRRGGEVEA